MAFDAGAVVAKLQLNITQWSKSIEKAKADSKSFEGLILRNSQQIKKLGQSLTVVGGIITGISGYFVKMAMDAEESENLFRESMENMAKEARDWSNELSKSLGLNQYEIRKTIGTFNVMLNSMGIAEEAAFDMSKALTQLSYDMASFYNLRPDEAFLKIQSAISGEIEPLKRLGIIVNETTIKNWALTNGLLKQGEQLTENQKILARFNVIMEQTKKAQGDLERTSDSLTNLLRRLRSMISELAVNLGNALLPKVASITKKIASLIIKINEWVLSHQKLAFSIIMVTAGFGALLLAIGPVLMALPGMAAFAAAIGVSMGTASIAILGVVAALASIPLAIQNLDYIKSFMWSFAESINYALSKLIESIEKIFEKLANLPNWVKTSLGILNPVFEPLINNAQKVVDSLEKIRSDFAQTADYCAKKAAESINAQMAKESDFKIKIDLDMKDLKNTIESFWNNIENKTKDTANNIEEVNKNWFDKMQENFNAIEEVGRKTFNAMADAFSTFFTDVVTGQLKSLGDYITSFFNAVLQALANVAANMLAIKIWSSSLFRGMLGGLGSLFGLGGSSTGLPRMMTSWQQGTEYIPYTGLYKLHEGERVTPKYDSNKESQMPLVIYNLLTPEGVARSMASREGKNVIINILDTNSLRGGAIRKVIQRG